MISELIAYGVYRDFVFVDESADAAIRPVHDPYCLATIKHYRGLIPMAQEYRKPGFNLTSTNGAIGSHANAAHDSRKDFKELAIKIAEKMGI